MLLSTMIATVFVIFITHALRSFAVVYYSSQNAVSTGCFGITSKRQIVQVMIGLTILLSWLILIGLWHDEPALFFQLTNQIRP